MKKYSLLFLLATAATFSSCEAIGDIFQAGMWAGVIAVVVIVALVIWIFNRMRR
jgi:hypothetical protein